MSSPSHRKRRRNPNPCNNGKKQAAPKKQPLTHFLCLPLVHDASRDVLASSLSRFKTGAIDVAETQAEIAGKAGETTKQANASALENLLRNDTRAVRPLRTLHLTLGVMSLREDAGSADEPGVGDGYEDGVEGAGRKTLQEAVGLLNDLDLTALLASPNIETGTTSTLAVAAPLTIDLRGLSSMHSPTKTSLLYTAPFDSSGRLLPFCRKLNDAFVQRGLMLDEKRKGGLKLHVTVLNTIYERPGGRRRPVPDDAGLAKNDLARGKRQVASVQEALSSETRKDVTAEQADSPIATQKWKRQKRGPLRFDATALLDHFADLEWINNLRLDRIALCKMGASKIKDGHGNIIDEAYEEVAVRPLPFT